MEMGDCKVYTLKETMEILKLSRSTMMPLLVSGKIKGIRSSETTRAKWLITSDAIKEFLTGNQ